MNFNDQDFNAFEKDVKRMFRDLESKYQLSMKRMKITYGEVDFSLKLDFEKNEEGLNTERIKFEENSSYYGFIPDDYMRTFTDNYGAEYELIGFSPSAKKYQCIVRNTLTGEAVRMNNRYVLSRLNSQ